jgi:hypothetical protein
MEKYDIVCVGAGPAGLMLSTCLARWGYRIKQIDKRPEPTKTGRADGIQPRSLDLLRNLGLKPAIMAHAPAKVYEVAFWDPSSTESGIVRTGTWASCPSFIDARYPFTTLLHQGMIERVFIDDLQKNGTSIDRSWTIKGFRTNEKEDAEYPVEVDLEHVDGTQSETVRTKYLFGGEGARSFVRDQLKIGIKHKDPVAHVWGVMDGVVKTDFPDIKVSSCILLFLAALRSFVDEMYHSLRTWLDHGHSPRRQPGSFIHPNRFLNRQGLEPSKNGNRRRGAELGQENIASLQHRMGTGRMVFHIPNWARHRGEVYSRSSCLHRW